MSEQQQQNAGEQETLRCIYCSHTLSWPKVMVWPSACFSCGRWPGAYKTANSPQLQQNAGEQETFDGSRCTEHCLVPAALNAEDHCPMCHEDD